MSTSTKTINLFIFSWTIKSFCYYYINSKTRRDNIYCKKSSNYITNSISNIASNFIEYLFTKEYWATRSRIKRSKKQQIEKKKTRNLKFSNQRDFYFAKRFESNRVLKSRTRLKKFRCQDDLRRFRDDVKTNSNRQKSKTLR